MADRSFAIITEWGSRFGTGHIQRMSSLLWYLNTSTPVKTMILNDRVPVFLPDDLKAYAVSGLENPPALYIRDMRDSTPGEISSLQRTAPVLAIDDLGEGRLHAARSLDLLPNPQAVSDDSAHKAEQLFIFGFTFLRTIADMGETRVEKNIDIAFYPGSDASPEYISFIISLLPPGASCALFTGRDSYIFKGKERKPFNRGAYASILLASKVLITHFGIMLYEAQLAGCRVITINPTEYHSRLADIAPAYLGITNLGTREKLQEDSAGETIRGISQAAENCTIHAGEVYSAMRENLDRFYQYLKNVV